MLDSVRHLVDAGFAAHLLVPREKRPVLIKWASAPVATWEDLVAAYDGHNVGLRCGEPSKVGDHYSHVLDIDVRDPACAKEAHDAARRLLPEAATLPMVISGSGGASRHIHFLTDKPFRSCKLLRSNEKILGDDGKEHWKWEIELFGTGKQVVLPPSIHPDTGKPYVWKREYDLSDPAFVPSERIEQWAVESLGAGDEDDELLALARTSKLTELSIDDIKATLRDLPLDEWCEDRDGWCRVGMALHHQLDGSEEGYKLWTAFSKQSKKFDPKDQRKVWKSFKDDKSRIVRFSTLLQAASMAREGNSADLPFDEIDEEDQGEDQREKRLSIREKRLLTLNKMHAVARIAGKTVALTFEEDHIEFGTVSSLHEYYENKRQATEKGSEPITKWWMRHPDRRSYPHGVAFRPGLKVRDGVLNLWQGFSVKPAPGSCELYLEHLRDNICCGNEPEYRYLVGWMAHTIQKPWEKPGVAVVLKGEKGVGKDVVFDHFGMLFKQHVVKISQMEQLTGKFNAHMESSLLVHVEEGLWAGDKRAEGPLKSLITSPTLAIERKGLDVIQIESCARIGITSNERWVVPATRGERRFAVYNVGKDHMQDRPYFRAMVEQLEAGGYGALLHYLQTYDISDFDVGVAPDTEALGNQKIAGLKNHEAFWREVLDEGVVKEREYFDEGDWDDHPINVPVDDFYALYVAWWDKRKGFGHGSLLDKVEFGRVINEMCPGRERKQRGKRANRFNVHNFPPLPQCRAEFENYIGSKVTWETTVVERDIEDLL